MRRAPFGMALTLAALALPGIARAQQLPSQNILTDPFLAYYGWFLPRQAALSAQPGPTATLNSIAADRQYFNQVERNRLFEPTSPFGLEEYDPFAPFQPRRGREPLPSTHRSPTLLGGGQPAFATANQSGQGPPPFYNRALRYYPGLRREPYRQQAPAVRGSRGGGGGFGMPSIGGFY